MFSIKDRQRNDYKRQSGERCLTQLCHFLTTCIFYKVFTAGRFAYTPKQISVFTGKRCHFHSSRGVIFTRSYLLRPANIHVKNYSAIARRKNIPFYPARTGMNFSASEALIQISQPANLPRFFFQLAQILPEERVICRAAPLGIASPADILRRA